MKKGQKSLAEIIGDPDVFEAMGKMAALYEAAEMSKFHQFKDDGTELTLTLFGCFRLSRLHSGKELRILEKDISSGIWKETPSLHLFERFGLWPITAVSSIDVTMVTATVVNKLSNVSGFEELAERKFIESSIELDRIIDEEVDDSQIRRLMAETMGLASTRAWAIFSAMRFKKRSVKNALIAFKRDFFRHMRDRDVFRAVLSANNKRVTVQDYVHFSGAGDDAVRIFQERRNLMPLLPYINQRHWSDTALFSKKNWTSQDGLVARGGFTDPGYGQSDRLLEIVAAFQPFHDTRSFNWLVREKNSVVKAWIKHGKDPDAAFVLSRLGIKRHLPALISSAILYEYARRKSQIERGQAVATTDDRVVRLFKLFADQLEDEWRNVGCRELTMGLMGQNFETSMIVDYLNDEGFNLGLPARNSTWASLENRSLDWHAANGPLHATFMERANLPPDTSWEPILGPINIDGYRVSPVSTLHALKKEGASMRHCVASYAWQCAQGLYLVFSIEGNGEKATAGYDVRSGKFILDQVRGMGNGPVSETLARVARTLQNPNVSA